MRRGNGVMWLNGVIISSCVWLWRKHLAAGMSASMVAQQQLSIGNGGIQLANHLSSNA